MAGNTKLQGEIVKKYLTKFPNTPSQTLAKKIYSENSSMWTKWETVYSSVRYYRGQSGDVHRKMVQDKIHFKPEGSRNPFNLPVSHAETYEPVVISQSKTLIISDLHFPYQDNDAITLALNYGLEKKVDCILINGDLIDFATISRHEKDFRSRSVKEEFDAVREFLSTVRNAFPKTKIVFKYGNHDERWEKWLFLKAPEIFDFEEFQLEIILKFAELKIEVVKDKLPIKIGKLNILHGHELNGGGGVNPARGAFLRTLDNVIIGHFHRSSEVTEATFGGNIINVRSTGCLCGMYPMYARVNKWNLGFAYVELDIKTGEYELENLKIINGKIYK